MLEAIIFDFDGTLADTQDRQFQWFQHWSRMNEQEKFGYFNNYFQKIYELDKKISGPDLAELNEILTQYPGPFRSVETAEEFFPIYNEIINKTDVQTVYHAFNLPCDMSDFSHPVWPAFNEFNIRHPAPLFAGVQEALKEIWQLTRLPKKPAYNKQIRMAINTTNSWKGIYPNLKKYDVLDYFDSHICSEALKEYDGNGNHKAINKPSKVSVALSLLLLDASGDSTIFVGDTLADLGACVDVRKQGLSYKKENLITVGVTWGYDGRDVISQGVKTANGQEYFKHIVDTPEELVGVIKEYANGRE